MWKVILVLMAITSADQRVIVQQPLGERSFAAKAECDAFVDNWQKQAKQPELLRLAEARAPAHRGNIKWVNLIDAGCADPAWSGAFPVLKDGEGFPPAPAHGEAKKPAH
ncbi:MAG: hypothetical protein IT562_12235 [Alphaproteobacteria bacterium]|nr:hypothetical protein [Alphaproteobacteria bacterium]